MNNDPVDVLELAARRLYWARQAFHGTAFMQASPAAEVTAERARIELELASSDVDRARRLAVELCDLA